MAFSPQTFACKSYTCGSKSVLRTAGCLLRCDSVIYYIPGWTIKRILNIAPVTEIEVPLQVVPTTRLPE